ncbi:MAG TPA: M23 family metallopeptidase [Novosphingobium sp.]|nr:M23 family metallopeptidase [Novosphingobium sp.]
MVKPREVPHTGQGGSVLTVRAEGVAVRSASGSWLDRFEQRRAEWAARIEGIDWAPDLAEDIGSATWFRGLGTLVGLSLAALAFWPEGDAIAAAPAMPLDASARDEFRSQMIQPLAFGADSGRRMGATKAVTPLASAPGRSTVQLTATLAQGDSFLRMLTRAGVSEADAGAVTQLVAAQLPVSLIAPGTQVDLRLGAPDPATGVRPLEHAAFRARFDLDLSIDRTDGQLRLSAHPIAVDTTPMRIRGVVGTSLYRSARAAGAPIEAIQQYLETLDQHVSLDTAIEAGDTFDIIVAAKRSANGEVEVGDLLYAGLERGGRNKAQLVRWGSEGQFFEASGMGAQRTGLIMPVYGGRVTSGFGARRHPVLGYTRMHAGIDFGAPHGAPIYAVGDATVIFSGWHGGHGNYVKLDHGGGYATAYAHMSRIAVPSGQRVRAGQVIGYVGSTGLSTGPHLHYELYRNGQAVNPLSVSFTVSSQVDAKELAAFRARLAALKTIKPGAAMTSLGPRQAATAQTAGREIDRLKS